MDRAREDVWIHWKAEKGAEGGRKENKNQIDRDRYPRCLRVYIPET